ncbi:hypothetical protein BGZ83_002763 [Gryganskiella cystojenkinii]|nr:hypothetical protein BGZ83_002763 [Gryganskiella cystojenkinii]
MKFLATVAVASAVVAVASAQLQINNPTSGSVWTTGQPQYVSWTGDCAAQGNAAHSIGAELVNGPSSAVLFVASVGTVDCSSPTNTTTYVTVPNSVVSGPYSLRILTTPNPSYSVPFTVKNAAAPPAASSSAPAQPTTTTPAGGNGNGSGNSANSLVSTSALALVGSIAVAAAQLLL